MKDLKVIKDFVESKLKNEPTGHDYTHALRVFKNALKIMQFTSGDYDIVNASCLVHDLIDHKLEEKFKATKDEIKEVLIKAKYSPKDVVAIFNIIENISYSKGGKPDTIEGKIVQDADRLDALGAIGIARTFSFGGRLGRQIYSEEKNGMSSVEHFYDKLLKLENLMNTGFAKGEAKKRTEYMREFLQKLDFEIK